jgi:dethiobiotin synthetase
MHKQSIFITATNTDVGKTYAAGKFLQKFAREGKRVGYFKPIETGVSDIPLDGSKMLELAKSLNPDFKVSLNDVVPYRFELPAAPFCAKGDVKIDIELIKQKRDQLLGMCDILVIEGAGGLMVPIEKNYFMIDLIKDLECEAMLITPSRLGCINDTMLSIDALKRAEVPFKWFVNLFSDKESYEKATLPFYREYFKKIYYINDI